MTEPPSLIILLERIRSRLDKLATAPLSDADLVHLVAVDEWLADLEVGVDVRASRPASRWKQKCRRGVEMSPALAGTVSREWKIDGLLDAIKSIGSTQDITYEVKKMQQYREALLSMAPFQVGDRVVLVAPPTIERSSGWYASRHFLVAGALGTVREVDWMTPSEAESGAEGYWSVFVMFDRESWLSDYDEDNQRIPKDAPRREVFTPEDRRHVYGMAARRFAPADVR